MNPAILSLIALLVAIAISMATKLNVGVMAMAFAWLIGVYVADFRPEQVAAGFPSTLFLTLTGVTLLFALAESNGTLERLAHRAVGLARGPSSRSRCSSRWRWRLARRPACRDS
jgi:di/tricarboxylate transporter